MFSTSYMSFHYTYALVANSNLLGIFVGVQFSFFGGLVCVFCILYVHHGSLHKGGKTDYVSD